jgi:hypothetical protein
VTLSNCWACPLPFSSTTIVVLSTVNA